jgi:hypothetical protein
VEFEPGFRFGIAFGHQFNKYVKVEVEGGFHYNGIKSIAGATSSSGNLYRAPVMGIWCSNSPIARASFPSSAPVRVRKGRHSTRRTFRLAPRR